MEIVMSSLAKRQLNNILDYVEEEYGPLTARKMLQKTEERLHRLSVLPESGTRDAHLSTSEYTVRHILIAPNVFYYICTESTIIIGAIMHTKQSPKTVADAIRCFFDSRKTKP